jgi:trimethylamine corrinoid protein
MPFQREVIEILGETGERNNFKVLIGGGPVTGGYADEIGSDGYGKDAVEAVEIAKHITGMDPAAGSGGST